MAYLEPIDEKSAKGPLKQIYDAAERRAGYVANIIKATSHDPAGTQCSLQLYIHLMKSDNALAPADREMLATVVSNANGCFY